MRSYLRIAPTWLRLALVAAMLSPSLLHAQAEPKDRRVTGGFGVGFGVGDRHNDESGSGLHGLGYVMIRQPTSPFGFRFDALLAKYSTGVTALSLIGNAVAVAQLPLLQPYAVAGVGYYGLFKDASRWGVNGGVGVRLHVTHTSIFGEVRRHQRLGRDLFTFGVRL
jgi:hypothetical protein